MKRRKAGWMSASISIRDTEEKDVFSEEKKEAQKPKTTRKRTVKKTDDDSQKTEK